ncbi:MAG: RNA polymerase sigma-70 factor, partial [Candidatus Cryptobacteroides sp.]
LERLGMGDRKAFAILYECYAGRCINFVLALSGDAQLAKDITHDIFLRIWKLRESVSKADSFEKYLMRMVYNSYVNSVRKEQVERRFRDYSLPRTENSDVETDSLLLLDEMKRIIDGTIDAMPPQRREIFKMSRIQGLENREIARKLGLSVRTVEKHISNALLNLRISLKIKKS